MSSTEKDEDVTGIDNKIRYQPFSYLGFFFRGGGTTAQRKLQSTNLQISNLSKFEK
jgi:hypothetical protein